jgi:hypothetical protein
LSKKHHWKYLTRIRYPAVSSWSEQHDKNLRC